MRLRSPSELRDFESILAVVGGPRVCGRHWEGESRLSSAGGLSSRQAMAVPCWHGVHG